MWYVCFFNGWTFKEIARKRLKKLLGKIVFCRRCGQCRLLQIQAFKMNFFQSVRLRKVQFTKWKNNLEKQTSYHNSLKQLLVSQGFQRSPVHGDRFANNAENPLNVPAHKVELQYREAAMLLCKVIMWHLRLWSDLKLVCLLWCFFL